MFHLSLIIFKEVLLTLGKFPVRIFLTCLVSILQKRYGSHLHSSSIQCICLQCVNYNCIQIVIQVIQRYQQKYVEFRIPLYEEL